MYKVQKYIKTQDGEHCWNVTHIAGYGLTTTITGKKGIRVLPRVEYFGGPSDVPVLIYVSDDAEKVKEIFNELIGFLRDEQSLYDCSSIK